MMARMSFSKKLLELSTGTRYCVHSSRFVNRKRSHADRRHPRPVRAQRASHRDARLMCNSRRKSSTLVRDTFAILAFVPRHSTDLGLSDSDRKLLRILESHGGM